VILGVETSGSVVVEIKLRQRVQTLKQNFNEGAFSRRKGMCWGWGGRATLVERSVCLQFGGRKE
jgi:hypothetical protein